MSSLGAGVELFLISLSNKEEEITRGGRRGCGEGRERVVEKEGEKGRGGRGEKGGEVRDQRMRKIKIDSDRKTQREREAMEKRKLIKEMNKDRGKREQNK